MKSSESKPEADREHGVRGHRQAITVAVIEIDPNVQALLERHLEEAGYQCWCEGNGQAALKRIARHAPDLILLGQMLPGHSGTDLLAELGRDTTTQFVPVIVLTAKNRSRMNWSALPWVRMIT